MNLKTSSPLPIKDWMAFREIHFRYDSKDLLFVYYRKVDFAKLQQKKIVDGDGTLGTENVYPLDELDELLYSWIQTIDPEARRIDMLLCSVGDQAKIKSKYLGFPIGEIQVTINPIIDPHDIVEAEKFEGLEFTSYRREYRIHMIAHKDLKNPIPVETTYKVQEAEHFNRLMAELDQTVVVL